MVKECHTSFADLFGLARQRPWSDDERQHFMSLPQDDKNLMVKLWAEEAGCVTTEDRLGTDGLVYTAFWINE